MNVIECIHCKAKYAIKLHKIPKHQKFLKCSQCQDNTPFPFYFNEKEKQEFHELVGGVLDTKKSKNLLLC